EGREFVKKLSAETIELAIPKPPHVEHYMLSWGTEETLREMTKTHTASQVATQHAALGGAVSVPFFMACVSSGTGPAANAQERAALEEGWQNAELHGLVECDTGRERGNDKLEQLAASAECLPSLYCSL